MGVLKFLKKFCGLAFSLGWGGFPGRDFLQDLTKI
jgi:hypothetical protein